LPWPQPDGVDMRVPNHVYDNPHDNGLLSRGYAPRRTNRQCKHQATSKQIVERDETAVNAAELMVVPWRV